MPETAGACWAHHVQQVGGDAVVAAASGAELDARYAEAHRHYHVGAHVLAVLRDCAELAAALSLSAPERVAVALAACAHDVVYDARPGADERASAAWARRQLRAAGVGAEYADRVAGLVLTTLTHEAPAGDPAAAVLLDADLAILATDPPGYARYVAAVRAEYAAVDDAAWRAGRSAVLSGLADRPRIYLTEPGRARWEQRARHNLVRELADLNGAP